METDLKPKCFIDMDGTLTNFTDAANKVHGIDGRLPDWKWAYGPEGWWDCTNGMSLEQFFAPMGREFWANLEWFDYSDSDERYNGDILMYQCEQTYGKENICILTSPCQTHGCIEGKMDWIDTYIPEYRNQVLFGSCKDFCAGPGAVLYDDNDGHIEAFQARGGQGILLPRPWNSMWEEWVCKFQTS